MNAAEKSPIIFDTDIGSDIDDAFALAFLLQSPELDVRAVTVNRFEAETRARLAWKIMGASPSSTTPLPWQPRSALNCASTKPEE
jgi:inosine-uridine nucleoside N-ribohydrolase